MIKGMIDLPRPEPWLIRPKHFRNLVKLFSEKGLRHQIQSTSVPTQLLIY